MKKVYEIAVMAIVSIIIIILGYHGMTTGKYVGIILFASGFIPLVTAKLVRLEMKRLIPDIAFGVIDTGLLTIFTLVGGRLYGVLGAVVFGVVGDSVTDGIAGFFEGGVAEWLRGKGIEESRLPLSSGLGKLCGCLFISGTVLTVATLLGIGVEGLKI